MSVRVTILVDDQADEGLRSEHGFSALVDVNGHRILLDTGQSGDVLVDNAEGLGIDLGTLDAIVISHSHYDHVDGIGGLLLKLKAGIPIYCAPNILMDATGRLDICADVRPQKIVEGVMTTGRITRTTPFEAGEGASDISGGAVKMEEQALIVRCDKGLLVVVGCSHPGPVNIVRTAKEMGGGNVFALLGGLHLRGASEELLRDTSEALKAEGVEKIYPAHCTGPGAFEYLERAFGESYVQCAAGESYDF